MNTVSAPGVHVSFGVHLDPISDTSVDVRKGTTIEEMARLQIDIELIADGANV